MADVNVAAGLTYDGNTGRKCWATARERNRMRARYAIRQRVFGNCSLSDETVQMDGNGFHIHRDSGSDTDHLAEENIPRYDLQYGKKIQEVLRRIVRGDTSYFSILFMEENFSLLNNAFPVSLIWETGDAMDDSLLEYQRLRSRLGRDGVARLVIYLCELETCTVLEYAVWLIRYRIIRQLILGGIDLTIRGRYHHRQFSDQPYRKNDVSIGTMVQKYFFAAFIPLGLSCYIVSRMVELRRSAWTRRQTMDPSTVPVRAKCEVCGKLMEANVLLFLWESPSSGISCPFHHQFCDSCLWMDIVENLRYRLTDVVACPVCCAKSLNDIVVRIDNSLCHGWNDLSNAVTSKTISHKRFEESLRRYKELPLDSLMVKRAGRKKKHVHECEMIYSTWSEAVQSSLGRTQTARRDKFLHSAERGSFHYVKGCLDAGVDVNVQNEYGQTALLIAVWLNFVPVVQLLLDYGGDPCIPANGKVTCWSVAFRHNQQDILDLLRTAGVNDGGNALLLPFSPDCALHSSNASFSLLIDWSSNHPGAGSFSLDECFVAPYLDSLIGLWSSLPLEVSSKKKAGPCSERSYYCDVHGTITTTLSSVLRKAAFNHDLPFTFVACGPHMRFLSYSESGAILAPHIDLSRTDPQTEARSTHSFLLYLTTCEYGGETSLIGDVTGEGRNLVLASVAPKRGRLLVFPHRCPHEGLLVVDTPKVLIRGELWLRLQNG
jgi:2OG-Fe(II) oxygenase superfamily/Ankyrin repeats (many copies)